MPDTLDWIIVVGLVVVGVFVSNQWKYYRIRRMGTRVMAKVIRVDSWQVNFPGQAIVPAITAMPLIGGGWEYEVSAEYTNPDTGENALISSGRKKGLPRYQRGDYLPAYVSPRGNYLQLM
jgi:hypothetical protein